MVQSAPQVLSVRLLVGGFGKQGTPPNDNLLKKGRCDRKPADRNQIIIEPRFHHTSQGQSGNLAGGGLVVTVGSSQNLGGALGPASAGAFQIPTPLPGSRVHAATGTDTIRGAACRGNWISKPDLGGPRFFGFRA